MEGRAISINIPNRFEKLKTELIPIEEEWEDEAFKGKKKMTEVFLVKANEVVNKVESPDLPMRYSMNPYQGCEHGCAYCYARPSHEYWGFSPALDFEQKIVVKTNVHFMLSKKLSTKEWYPTPIALSGNTDCYQPIERKYELTRKCLETFLCYGNPVGIITKNSLILRDLDILKELNKESLVHVAISITTLDEDLRRMLEPRTATVEKKLETVRVLSEAGIPVSVMMAPIIPGLNDHEIPTLLKAVSEAGALTAGYTMVRLNGALKTVFSHWIKKNLPLKASKVLKQIAEVHNGTLNDSRFGLRMSGEGEMAELIGQWFRNSKELYFKDKVFPEYRLDRYRPHGVRSLFD